MPYVESIVSIYHFTLFFQIYILESIIEKKSKKTKRYTSARYDELLKWRLVMRRMSFANIWINRLKDCPDLYIILYLQQRCISTRIKIACIFFSLFFLWYVYFSPLHLILRGSFLLSFSSLSLSLSFHKHTILAAEKSIYYTSLALA